MSDFNEINKFKRFIKTYIYTLLIVYVTVITTILIINL